MLLTGWMVGLGLYLLYISSRCGFRVEEGYLGVVLTFGAASYHPRQGADSDEKRLVTSEPGFHFKWPWQRVVLVSMMEQNLELSGEVGGRTAMAEDGTILRFDSILRYQPVQEELTEFLFGLKAPLEHITGLFTCLLRNEIANFRPSESTGRSLAEAHNEAPHSRDDGPDFTARAGSFALIRRERQRLNSNIASFARTEIGTRYGVRFNAVDLVDILPPDELAAALNAVMQAQTEADARYYRSQGDCQQRVLGAERGVAIAKSRAEAAALEIDILGSHLGQLVQLGGLRAYVDRRRAEILGEVRTAYVNEKSAP